MGGASGAGSLLLNAKASQEAACSCAPAAIVPGQEPESRDAGVSRFAENGSHPAEVNAAEGPAGQVDGPGSSGNAENGSHLESADFSNEPGAVMWRIVVAQVRRKSMMARLRQSRCDTKPDSAGGG